MAPLDLIRLNQLLDNKSNTCIESFLVFRVSIEESSMQLVKYIHCILCVYCVSCPHVVVSCGPSVAPVQFFVWWCKCKETWGIFTVTRKVAGSEWLWAELFSWCGFLVWRGKSCVQLGFHLSSMMPRHRGQ